MHLAWRNIIVSLALTLPACATNHRHESTKNVPMTEPAQIEKTVKSLMAGGNVAGLALAIVRDGKVAYIGAFGSRDIASNAPLQTDTILYGASLTKLNFAYMVMQLVDRGIIDLDRSIADYLPKPLLAYEKYADLANDERWRKLTPRLLLSHRSGFPNFRFFAADGRYDENGKLYFAFDPGTRYAYSGEGINLLQFVIENGIGLDVGTEMQTRVFDRLGMTRTSMLWREDFADNLATNYDESGAPLLHKSRKSVRAAGSMDTTIADQAKLLVALLKGEGLSIANRRDMFRAQAPIDSIQQFPTLSEQTSDDNRAIGLSAGLGMVVYDSPLGKAWFKSGHDDGTNNIMLGFPEAKTGIVILSNSSNGESIFRHIFDALLGPTCMPWFWENDIPYDHPEWKQAEARQHAPAACAALPPH